MSILKVLRQVLKQHPRFKSHRLVLKVGLRAAFKMRMACALRTS